MQDEIGDVMNYLVRLSDRLDIEPLQAAMQKIAAGTNEFGQDYPNS